MWSPDSAGIVFTDQWASDRSDNFIHAVTDRATASTALTALFLSVRLHSEAPMERYPEVSGYFQYVYPVLFLRRKIEL
jgi:hypothetical protein